ncbi:Alpha-L-arabinofuranosidase [Verrucomicrobium sp. GAS474]|uniref:hypothetical protein n=1 Tax=Verrucomicrobium sp. GAS474 TaxID=1882831 RepID=UPI00087A8265|nr:hypothetical protein [Verrucomicrobium sp. GAS474]SDT99044.1 Alpha-L-arabinofuranosidase [Verrucomicrobium sp. GAS474]
MIPSLSLSRRLPLCLLTLAAMGVSSFPSLLWAEEKAGPGTEYDGVKVVNSDPVPTEEPLPVRIVVDETRVVKPFDREIFGINYDWEATQPSFISPLNPVIDPAPVEMLMKGIKFPLNRVAGSDSQVIDFKKSIGPVESRPGQKLWPWSPGKPLLFGPVELFSWLRKVDPDSHISYTVNLHQPAEETGDIAEFLVGDAKATKPDGAVNWAAKRAEYGMPDPVPVAIWELGSEIDFGRGANHWTVDRYIKAAKAVIPLIRAVDPNAKFAMGAITAPWGGTGEGQPPWRNWHQTILKEMGGDLAYITFHPYYYGFPVSSIDGYLDQISQDINAAGYKGKIKIYNSEHAVWPSMPADGKWEKMWFMTHSLGGCLGTSLIYGRWLNRPDVGPAAYHAFSAGPWWMISRQRKTERLHTSGIAELFRLLSKIEGENVVQSEAQGALTDVRKPDLQFDTAAIRRADGTLQLFIANRGGPRTADFSLGKDYAIADSCQLTSTGGMSSVNTPDEQPITVKDGVYPADETKSLGKLDLPARSVTLLTLKKR